MKIEFDTCERVTSAGHATPAWHAARAKGIGGSDASIILGANPWTTPKQAWELKTGRRQPDEGNAYTRLGTMLEDAILERAYFGHAVKGKVYGSMRSLDRAHMLANIDGTHAGRLVEVKTTGKRWLGKVPSHYLAQVRHYLYVCGLDEADLVECHTAYERGTIVACLDAGLKPDRVVEKMCSIETHRVVQDVAWLAKYLEAADAFWLAVEADMWASPTLDW
jgi:putative phage-type endonuclease